MPMVRAKKGELHDWSVDIFSFVWTHSLASTEPGKHDQELVAELPAKISSVGLFLFLKPCMASHARWFSERQIAGGVYTSC